MAWTVDFLSNDTYRSATRVFETKEEMWAWYRSAVESDTIHPLVHSVSNGSDTWLGSYHHVHAKSIGKVLPAICTDYDRDFWEITPPCHSCGDIGPRSMHIVSNEINVSFCNSCALVVRDLLLERMPGLVNK